MTALSSFGATTILTPAQVAREFAQRSWQKKDGLPDNTVQALLQTRDGFLWIGTRRGLVRFDGLKFVVFDHLNTPEMKNDNCRSLAEDLEGNLWIAIEYGLLRWHEGKFKQFTKKDGLTDDEVGSVYADHRGNVWFGSSNGLDRLRNGTIIHFGREQHLEGLRDYGLYEDSFGVLWTGDQFQRFNERTERFEIWPDTRGLGIRVSAIQNDGASGLWLLCSTGSRAHWLCRFSNGQWERISEQFSTGFRNAFLSADRYGGLWMSSGDGGLDRFHKGQFIRYSLPSEMGHDFVLCLKEDREGNLWFGTELSGLHCWKPRAISAYAARESLAHDNTWTMCEARDGSVWIGTEAGLSQFKDGRFRNFTKTNGLSGDKIRSVAEDASGAIWVGTGSGLSVIRDGVAKPQAFPHEPERNKIRSVCTTKSRAVWVGTVAGLFRYSDEVWTTFTPTNGLAKAGLYGDVLALREDKSGTLWIGTAGGGLQSYRDGKFTTWTTTNGLSNNSVWALHADADGALWIGTESGLNRFAGGRFTVFTTREGLPADSVNEILEDDFGNLWISHDHGIYRVRKQELNEVAAGRAKQVQTVSYDEADGLPSNETNGQKSYPAGCKTRDGRLWFPTTKGVAVIDPKLCDLDSVAPQATVESVRVDGEVILDRSGGSAERRHPAGEENGGALPRRRYADVEKETLVPLILPPGSGRVLEFRYTAPVFTAPEKATFRYRLRGVDDRWIEAGTRREAYFTRLRPGAYIFEVKAANHRGVWGERAGSFSFAIQPFFYQTWWFYSVCGAGAIGLLGAAVVWRIRKLQTRHQLQQQSAITAERSRIAKDLHDGLGADLTRLTLLADLAGDESATGSGEHARKLSQTSREAARELKELIWVANPANDSLDGLISRIASTTEEFLHDARIKCRLEIAPDLPARRLSVEQRRNLLLVAREAVNNVVKHSGATEVSLRMAHREGTLTLQFVDDGRGFDPRTARAEGLGLDSMKKRVENLGGTFELESRPGMGTKITIQINLIQQP